jgi:hypothetical protein
MRNHLLLLACVAVSACTPDDSAHMPIFLVAPYNSWPTPPAGTPIEPGRPVSLKGGQQETVVTGVLRWMKDPASVQFRGIEAVQNSRGRITVCGEVNGRTATGRQVGMEPFVGVLMAPDADADFVLVGIGSSDRDRAEVIQLCRASGIFRTSETASRPNGS